MKLRNILIVTENLERAKKFYRELFGLDVILDGEENAVLTEGLVLQDRAVWQELIGREVLPENHASELYFEEPEIEAFAERLSAYEMPVRYASELTVLPWGQKVLRIYDPDGHLIEVRTPAGTGNS